MGQGTESCGGYEVYYDEYEEELASGFWVEHNGRRTHVTKMSSEHLRNCLRLVRGLVRTSTFTSEAEKWNDWVETFEVELLNRAVKASKKLSSKKISKPPQKPRGKMVKMVCHCGSEYEARQADLNRGFGYSCGKRCAAIRRDYGRPKAQPLTL